MSFIDKFDSEFGPKLGIRMTTFRAVMREAEYRNVKYIFETGCIRVKDNWAGDGQSTFIFNEYVKCAHKERILTTVDIDQAATDLVRSLMPGVRTLTEDSVAAIAIQGCRPIDLLYLDSFDLDASNSHPAALHCLMEFTAAQKLLHPGSIVFVDDSPFNGHTIHGKGHYVGEYFKKIGVQPFALGYQAAWLMP